MSSIVGAITGSGGKGSGFNAQSANLLNPATVKQANEQYANVNQGLQNQAGFLNALQAQNGIGNQSQVYNQLQGIANGTGPNPAQAMLNNSTGQNIANQAALMAGQRGSSANAGLIAREAANQGANLQQQAAGQGAALQAQQSMNAIGQAGNLASNQVANQGQATNAYTNSAQGAQQNILNAIQAQNNAAIGNASQINNSNAELAKGAQTGGFNLLGNLAGAAGTALAGPLGGFAGSLFGSATKPTATAGGAADTVTAGAPTMMAAEGGKVGPKSRTGQYFCNGSKTMMARGGKVPALVSPGEKYLSPEKVSEVQKGANPMKLGETIPGKAKVSGAKNSYANDTVPKTLDEGGIILPRSVTQAEDRDAKARAFVQAVMHGKKK